VLQRRPYLRGATVRTRALVQWTSLSASLATWEDEPQLRARFPRAPAWGQAGIEEGGNVTTQAETTATGAATTSAEPARSSHVSNTRCPRRQRRPNTLLDPAVWDLK
jgi:hypothetical protein